MPTADWGATLRQVLFDELLHIIDYPGIERPVPIAFLPGKSVQSIHLPDPLLAAACGGRGSGMMPQQPGALIIIIVVSVGRVKRCNATGRICSWGHWRSLLRRR